jgi:ketosteroid isomerase-like protein
MTLTSDETKPMGDFGYDRGRFTFALTPKAAGTPAPPMDEGRYLVLLRKDTDGQWRVARDIGNSSLPMPMPMPAPPIKKDGK